MTLYPVLYKVGHDNVASLEDAVAVIILQQHLDAKTKTPPLLDHKQLALLAKGAIDLFLKKNH